MLLTYYCSYYCLTVANITVATYCRVGAEYSAVTFMKISQVSEKSTNVRACQNISSTQKTPHTPEG